LEMKAEPPPLVHRPHHSPWFPIDVGFDTRRKMALPRFPVAYSVDGTRPRIKVSVREVAVHG
jgi:hypothetical protein